MLYQGPAVVYKAQGGVSHLLVLWSSKFYGTTGLFLHIFTNSVSIFEIKQWEIDDCIFNQKMIELVSLSLQNPLTHWILDTAWIGGMAEV